MFSIEETLELGKPTPELEEILRVKPLHVGGWTLDTDIHQVRGIITQMGQAQRALDPDPTTLPYTEEDIDVVVRDGTSLSIRVHRPRHVPEDGCPVYVGFHGGGFMVGGHEEESATCRIFVSLGGIALSVEYRLAPEHPFPVPVEDSFDAAKWIAKNAKSLGISLEKGFILGGESAGADLALGVAYLYGKEKLSPPLTGIYSSVSSAATAETIPEKYRSHFLSMEQNAFSPMITKESLQLIKDNYKPEPMSPIAYPMVSQDLGMMPKTYFQACGMDPLRDCTLIMNEVWKEAGIATKIDVYPGLPHGFWTTFPTLEETKRYPEDCRNGFRWLLT